MPTQKHRVNVTLEQGTYDLLGQLAHLRGCSRSALVREFLAASEPMMRRTALLLEAAQELDERSVLEFERMLDEAESEVLDKMSILLDEQAHLKTNGGH